MAWGGGRRGRQPPNLGRLPGRHRSSQPARPPAARQDLITKLLAYNPDERLSARQALRHTFFRDLRCAGQPRRRALAVRAGWIRVLAGCQSAQSCFRCSVGGSAMPTVCSLAHARREAEKRQKAMLTGPDMQGGALAM